MPLAPGTSGPLAGLVVIDLTHMLAGPYCTMMLADLGARVIKVEAPGGDETRAIGPFIEGADGAARESGYFFSVNRGKESIMLDLKAEADRAVLDALLDGADLFMENFTPGVMDRLGYGWGTLHARHPRLIMGSISGFGREGPYSALPAYDIAVQGMGGIMSLTGEPDGPPTRVGVSIGDLGAGLFAMIGVQAALIERARTGLGKHLDIAMLDCQIALLENAIVRTQLEGRPPEAVGSRHPSITPFGAFRAKDTALVIGAGNERLYARLCETLGRPDLATDPRFADNELRTRNEPLLRLGIEAALSRATAAEWIARLREAHIPCGPINRVDALFSDPQVAARGMLTALPAGPAGPLAVAASPFRFEGDAQPDYRPAPRLDEHGAAIRRELGLG